MNFASYTDFRNAFMTLLTGDSVTSSALDFGQCELLVGMGEERVYLGDAMAPGMRAAAMTKTVTVTVTGGVGPLPADFLEAQSAYFDPRYPLDYKAPMQLASDNWQGGRAAVFTQEGSNLRVAPSQDGALTLRYYARLPSITTGPNALLNAYPLLFLYACLAEGGAFLGLPNTAAWEDRFKQLASAARRVENYDALIRPRIRSR